MDINDRAAEASKAIVVALIEHRQHPGAVLTDVAGAKSTGEIWGAVFQAVYNKVREALMSG